MQGYLQIMQKMLALEHNQADCCILVWALDSFHRRLTVNSKLVPGLDLLRPGLDHLPRLLAESWRTDKIGSGYKLRMPLNIDVDTNEYGELLHGHPSWKCRSRSSLFGNFFITPKTVFN